MSRTDGGKLQAFGHTWIYDFDPVDTKLIIFSLETYFYSM